LIALELKVPPLVLLVFTLAAIWGVSVLFPSGQLTIPGHLWIASTLCVIGILAPLTGVLSFLGAKTTVDPRVPDRSVQLVQTGIYRFSRNPMYLGFLLILASWAVYLSNWTGFLLLPFFIFYLNVFQIQPEEEMLLKKFGAPYQAYLKRVRRWI